MALRPRVRPSSGESTRLIRRAYEGARSACRGASGRRLHTWGVWQPGGPGARGKHPILCADSGWRGPGPEGGSEALGPVAGPGAVEAQESEADEGRHAAPEPAHAAGLAAAGGDGDAHA